MPNKRLFSSRRYRGVLGTIRISMGPGLDSVDRVKSSRELGMWWLRFRCDDATAYGVEVEGDKTWWERNNVISSDLVGITQREVTLLGCAEEENKSWSTK